jgi:hypothetical protein
MNTVHFDPQFGDAERRRQLYAGQLVVMSPRPSTLALVEFAREMLERAFGPIDPRQAQHHMPVEEFAAIVAPLKPAFIHHPTSWQLVSQILRDFGCDPDETYLDVPRLRISTSDGYLTSGVAYAHHPHRDTWWSAPLAQINWWMPIYPFTSESGMAFHPRYWSEGVENDSDRFNYYDWNTNQRKNAAQHVTSDTRWQPHATQALELQPEVRLVTQPGSPILFSGAQLHSTVPNTAGFTRYSIDFRVVNITDVAAKRGAPNVDSRPSGTSLRDFMRISDRQRVPEELCALYEDRPPEGVELVFQPV